jgi:hypothetical protein
MVYLNNTYLASEMPEKMFGKKYVLLISTSILLTANICHFSIWEFQSYFETVFLNEFDVDGSSRFDPDGICSLREF